MCLLDTWLGGRVEGVMKMYNGLTIEGGDSRWSTDQPDWIIACLEYRYRQLPGLSEAQGIRDTPCETGDGIQNFVCKKGISMNRKLIKIVAFLYQNLSCNGSVW